MSIVFFLSLSFLFFLYIYIFFIIIIIIIIIEYVYVSSTWVLANWSIEKIYIFYTFFISVLASVLTFLASVLNLSGISFLRYIPARFFSSLVLFQMVYIDTGDTILRYYFILLVYMRYIDWNWRLEYRQIVLELLQL